MPKQEGTTLRVKGATITVLGVIDNYTELTLSDWWDMLELAGKHRARPRTFEVNGQPDIVFLLKDADRFTDSELEEVITNWYKKEREG